MPNDDFQAQYGPLASDISDATGLDPSVVLGHIAQETGYGKHIFGNNLFGISPGGKVAAYPDIPTAAHAYVDLINSDRYASIKKLTDPNDQAQALQTLGYNRTPGYGNAVSSIAAKYRTAPSADDIFNQTGTVAPSEPRPRAPSAEDLFGSTPDLPSKASTKPAEPVTTASGIAKNVAAGVTDAGANVINVASDPVGNMIGKPLATLAVGAHDALAPYLGYERFPADVRGMLLGDNVPQVGNQAVNAVGTAMGAPSPDSIPANTDAERITRKATGNALTGAVVGPSAILPSAVGAVAGDVAAEHAPDWAKPAAELLGNVGGAAVAGGAQATAGGRFVNVDPAVAQTAELARDRYGINLKAPQIVGQSSPSVAYTNNALKMVPGSGYGNEARTVQGQFNRAISQTFGEDARKITPDVLDRAGLRIGATLDRVENANPVALDNTTINNLARIESNARSSLPDSEFGVIRRQLDNVLSNVQTGGTISGTTYGNLIHKGSPLDAAVTSGDSNIRNFAGQIKAELQDSLSRSLSPEDLAAYQQARSQYKNLKTVEPLTLRADAFGGAAPSTGDISPAALRQAVNTNFGPSIARAAEGEVPLRDLSRIGQMMKEPPSAGTSERGSVMATIGRLSEIPAAAFGAQHLGAGLLPAIGSAVAIPTIGRTAGSVLRSQWLANNLIQNGRGQARNPLTRAVPAAIAGNASRQPQ